MENQWIKITAPQMIVVGVGLFSVLCLAACVICTVAGMLPGDLLTATPMP